MARKRFSDLDGMELGAAFAKIYKAGFAYADETFKEWEEMYIATNDLKGVQVMKDLKEKIAKLFENPPKIEELY